MDAPGGDLISIVGDFHPDMETLMKTRDKRFRENIAMHKIPYGSGVYFGI